MTDKPPQTSTRHLVEPELLPALDTFPAAALDLEALKQRRGLLKAHLPSRDTYSRGVTITDHLAPASGRAPDVSFVLYRPAGIGPFPAYLHLHGGGYVFGSAEMCGMQNVATALSADCIVASVDYRLAPETRAPGNVEDCYAVLQWIHQQADALGIDPARIAIGGESAGGGLAAALVLLARDRGEVPVRFQLLLSPMLDDRTVVTDTDPLVGEFVWRRENNAFGWRALLGQEPGAPGISPYAAAARAEDLSGLPSAYVSVGALDLFRDEDIAYAIRLMRAGVPTELHVFPGAYHGFEQSSAATVVKLAQADRLRALKAALHPAG